MLNLDCFSSDVKNHINKSQSAKSVSNDGLIRKDMKTIANIIQEMALFIASEQEFVKESNKLTIQQNLEDLNILFRNIKSHPVISMQGLSINQMIISEQLEQTVNLFKKNQKPLARAKLNATMNLCISCHSQSPGLSQSKSKTIIDDNKIKKLKINEFDKAELLFVLREYSKAIAIYDNFLKNSKKADDDENVFKALERELIYFVKFKKDYTQAKAHFESLVKESHFDEKIKQEVNDWIKILSGKSLWEKFDSRLVKEEEMEKFIRTFIVDDEEGPIFSVTNSTDVYDLNLSSILIDYYNSHPETKLGPRILFWLAILEKRTNDELFFSLGDYYLLVCMEKYSKDPIAKECYEAYLDDLEINYLSKENKFPEDIHLKLKKLEKLLNIHPEKEE